LKAVRRVISVISVLTLIRVKETISKNTNSFAAPQI
jgi:hypothetical protein